MPLADSAFAQQNRERRSEARGKKTQHRHCEARSEERAQQRGNLGIHAGPDRRSRRGSFAMTGRAAFLSGASADVYGDWSY
jgi:hypothetical protein